MPQLAYRILLLSLAGGALFDALVPGNAAGVNAPLVMAAFLGVTLIVGGRDAIRRMDPADAWLAPVALLFSLLVVVRADDWLVMGDLLISAALAAGFVGCLAGGRITRGVVPWVLGLAVGAIAAAAIGAASVAAVGRTASRDTHPEADSDPGAAGWRRRIRDAAPVVRGLVIAVPVAAVFVVLFSAADAVFARLASDLLAWKPDIDIAELTGRVGVITIVAWGSAGLLGLAAGVLPSLASPPPAAVVPAIATPRGSAYQDPEGDTGDGSGTPAPPALPPSVPIGWAGTAAFGPGQAAAAATWPSNRGGWSAASTARTESLRLGSVEAATILVVIDLVFAAFVALQVAYLFGGRDTAALAGMTYAEYARRGFFELILVAGLAGLLVVALDLAVGKRSRIQLGGALVLLGLTAVVLLSAFLRLRLYQDAYGWTELRFVVMTAIAWLGVALLVAAALLLRRQARWVLHVLGILSLVTIGGMNLVGPQAFVTARNLERAIDPALVPAGGRTGVDTGYLLELGDEAVVPVVEAWDRLGTEARAALGPALEWRREQLATDPSLQGWPAWNLTRERARAALEGWEATRGTASR
jgi:hypothetical protein